VTVCGIVSVSVAVWPLPSVWRLSVGEGSNVPLLVKAWTDHGIMGAFEKAWTWNVSVCPAFTFWTVEGVVVAR
jgi:hypothetical protein